MRTSKASTMNEKFKSAKKLIETDKIYELSAKLSTLKEGEKAKKVEKSCMDKGLMTKKKTMDKTMDKGAVKPEGDKSAAKSAVKPEGDKSAVKPTGEKPAGEKPAEKSAGEKPAGEKPAGEKPAGEKPAGEKSAS
jgi:hypothetical protein